MNLETKPIILETCCIEYLRSLLNFDAQLGIEWKHVTTSDTIDRLLNNIAAYQLIFSLQQTIRATNSYTSSRFKRHSGVSI